MAAKEKRSPGRPKLEPSESRQETVTLRVRSQDAEKMRTAAKKDGLSFSAWARKTLLESAVG